MRIRKTIFGRQKYFEPNLFIGGVAGSIYTPALLASKLGINVNRVQGFRIIGSNIEAKILGTYTSPGDMFGSGVSSNADKNITYYIDKGALVGGSNGMFLNCSNMEVFEAPGFTTFTTGGGNKLGYTKIKKLEFLNFTNGDWGNQSMAYMSNLEEVIMPNAREKTNSGNATMSYCPNLKLVDFRRMRFLGRKTPNRGQIFTLSGGPSTVLKVHEAVQFVDVDGGLDVNVAYAKNTRGWTVEFYDNEGNYVSTL